ncbi:MAG: alpha/beta hydrolase [Actinophytocola sp.]|nr:alpha/beta hydrolase [Actinophytocola sp.]
MTEPTGPGVSNISVEGGAGGTEAQYEDLAAMGRLTDDVAADTLGVAMASQGFLVEPDVIASALLNPVGVAKFEAAMFGALDGPSGLTATSAAIGVRGLALRATNEVYQTMDDLAAKAFDASRWLAGAAITSNPLTAVTAGLVGGGAIAADIYLNYDGDWERWLVEHPGMLDELIAMSPGMLASLGIPLDVAGLTAVLAETYPDGEAVVTDVDKTADDMPPDDLEDLLGGLDARNEADDSNIDVRVVKDANGNVTGYVVDIPGTKDWNAPGTEVSANDLGVNVDAMAGNNTVLQKGIEEALARAMADQRPSAPDAPVMLVGHSQGGIVATAATDDLVAGGYNVTHVVTAGSPVGRLDIPDSVEMLSLENSGDIVPHLDAGDNPDGPNRTTVAFDNQTGTIGGNHAIGGNYVDAAGQLDSSSDPSVRRYLDGTGPFTGGTESTTYTYDVTREGVNDPQG